MKHTVKTIILTAVGTTLFWVVVIVCWFWLTGVNTYNSPPGRIAMEYHASGIGVVWVSNPGSQQVIASRDLVAMFDAISSDMQ